MAARSAGVLLYRRSSDGLAVLLVHPGGPFWRRRDLGAWSIPKGEGAAGETAETTARREVAEELGLRLSQPLQPLGHIRQKGGKEVEAFAVEQDFAPETLVSDRFEIEWPPRSGRRQTFPEVDRAAWFGLDEARRRINPAQAELLDRLVARLAAG